MPLVDQPFEDTFFFARVGPADYRDDTGVETTAAADQPRFDHTEAGEPRGLLIEGRPHRWRPDHLTVQAADWVQLGGTVLHEFEDADGNIRPRAFYAPDDPLGAVNACLNVRGLHRRIAYVPTYLRNRGGFVRWRRQDYALAGYIAVEPGAVLAAAVNIPILEG